MEYLTPARFAYPAIHAGREISGRRPAFAVIGTPFPLAADAGGVIRSGVGPGPHRHAQAGWSERGPTGPVAVLTRRLPASVWKLEV